MEVNMKIVKVHGYDVNEFAAEEIVEKIGLFGLSQDQLMYSFLEVMENINFSLEHNNKAKYEREMWNCSPTSFEVHRRFYLAKGIKLEFPPSEVDPGSLKFWINPLHVELLFYNLIRDGYLIPKASKFLTSLNYKDKFSYVKESSATTAER